MTKFDDFFNPKVDMVEECKAHIKRKHQEKILEKNKDVIQKFINQKDPHYEYEELWISFNEEYLSIMSNVELTLKDLELMYSCLIGNKEKDK